MSCTGNSNCTCGCCMGISVQTPQGESNPPGQSGIAYRTGTWATFKDSMLARLSSSDYPALAGLKTRDDGDFSIAMLDASAMVLDILTFYQERLANESYLRTATQLYSLVQLSQLIGYQPSPGVSASVYLAFNLSSAPGLPPNPNTDAITIPAGTTVQSVAAQGQAPQAFQTSADIIGKPDWNALPVQTGNPWVASDSATSVYLAGTATQLQQGDAILIVGETGAADPTTQPWYFALVSSVQPDAINQRTLVTWTGPVASSGTLSDGIPTFYALRQRAALFGYNAINPQMLTAKTQTELDGLLTIGPPPEWVFGTQDQAGVPKSSQVTLSNQSLVDLDAVYSKVIAQNWLVMIAQTSPPGVNAYPIQSAITTTRSDYGMSAKITRVTLAQPVSSTSQANVENQLKAYYAATRTTSVLVQSDVLPAAEQPLDHPLYGTLLDLEIVRDDLVGITAVAVTGNSPVVTLNSGVTLTFSPYDNSQGSVILNPGDQLTLLQPPPTTFHTDGSIPDWSTLTNKSTDKVTIVVADASGRPGTVSALPSQFTLALPPKNAPVVQELALVSSVVLVEATATTAARTRLVLANPLLNCYDRTVTTVNANVGAATGGSPVTELLGSGAAATRNQSFTLKQSPLTYVQAQTPTGSLSSLQVTANGAAWTEVPTLYKQAPTAQVYETINLVGGKATVQFGDGVEGATLPTGQNNIVANYRIGIGSAGNVGPGTITTLVDRPLGVNGVNNPMAATGGQDPQSIDDIRSNAPQTVLTLGRAVSITDYQNFAATFAGIAKAYAIWIPNGVTRGVFVTVAATDGAALQPPNLTLTNLTNALTSYGVPYINVQVQSFYETLFGLNAEIAYDPAYDSTTVEAMVMAELTSTYSFASRTFGQGVSGDEIAALVQGVPGVVAVNVTSLTLGPTSAAGDLGSVGFSVATWQNWIAQHVQPAPPRPHSGSPTIICPYIPVATIGALPPPADILVLNPDPSAVTLGVMG
jgi:predicted phage baseplate assembly protein